jgi:hypothetical protein
MELWADVALRRTLPLVPKPRVGERYQWLSGDLRRAMREQKGGLTRDVAETLRHSVGAHHTLVRAGDMGPALHQSARAARHIIRKGGPS